MATSEINELPAASAGNVTGALKLEIEDANGDSAHTTGQTLRTKMFAGGTGFTAADPLTAGPIVATTVTPSGLVDISGAAAGQVKFPASQNASANANTLDDYEEGTFTPTVTAGVTSPIYSTQSGKYVKIGRAVHVALSIATSSGTRDANQLALGGLPFAADSINSTGSFGQVTGGISRASGTALPLITVFSSGVFFYDTDGTSFVGNDLTAGAFEVNISAVYMV